MTCGCYRYFLCLYERQVGQYKMEVAVEDLNKWADFRWLETVVARGRLLSHSQLQNNASHLTTLVWYEGGSSSKLHLYFLVFKIIFSYLSLNAMIMFRPKVKLSTIMKDLLNLQIPPCPSDRSPCAGELFLSSILVPPSRAASSTKKKWNNFFGRKCRKQQYEDWSSPGELCGKCDRKPDFERPWYCTREQVREWYKTAKKKEKEKEKGKDREKAALQWEPAERRVGRLYF